MAIAENALVTLARQKTYLKIDTADHDTILEMLIDGVSSMFDLYTVRTRLRARDYDNLLLDGSGKNRLYLPDFPINIITTLEEDDVELTEDTDFYTYSRYNQAYLRRAEGVWPEGLQNIDISFNAGFHILEMFHFDSGGTTIPEIGDTLIGNTSEAEGDITTIELYSGIWASGTAAGCVCLEALEGTWVDNETVKIGGNGAANVMTVNEPYDIIRVPKDLELAVMQQIAIEFQRQQNKEWGETSRSFADGSIGTLTEEDFLPYVERVLKKYRRKSI